MLRVYRACPEMYVTYSGTRTSRFAAFPVGWELTLERFRRFLQYSVVVFGLEAFLFLMGNIFPRWSNTVPVKVIIGLGLVAGGVAAGINYYGSPKYMRQGY